MIKIALQSVFEVLAYPQVETLQGLLPVNILISILVFVMLCVCTFLVMLSVEKNATDCSFSVSVSDSNFPGVITSPQRS